MAAVGFLKAKDDKGIGLLVFPHCEHCCVAPVFWCGRPVAGKEKSSEVKISLHEVCVVPRKADTGTRVDREVICDLDGALHCLDDEDDGDQAGEALLRKPCNVADKKAAEKEVKQDMRERFGPGIRGNEHDEHGGEPEADPDAKREIFPAKARAKLINLNSRCW